ncbi:MAG: M23 family metallopeptidase [Spirochaetes bacterium]|nr:M23 family metallopeptidase [Spirochaetota bacterium]
MIRINLKGMITEKSGKNKISGNHLYILLLLGIVVVFFTGAVLPLRITGGYIFYPKHWKNTLAYTFEKPDKMDKKSAGTSLPAGGRLEKTMPLEIYHYRAKPGDTLSGISERFSLTLDTIASLNRRGGKGVHILSVGEIVKIPSMNGIYLNVNGNLDALCKSNDLSREVVLKVNGLKEIKSSGNARLFFPGVQHTGIDRSIAIGVAFLKPVRGVVSSGYGFRKDPFNGKIRFHRGIDIAAPIGTYVHAAMDGRIIAVGHDSILGNYILIKHPAGFSTLYGHLSRILAVRGKTVRKGEIIGRVGQTGRATGPHLHFEIRRLGRTTNPEGMIPKI